VFKTISRMATIALLVPAFGSEIGAQTIPTFEVELGGWMVGQSRNDVQIPNDPSPSPGNCLNRGNR
jgi:hypothetical protein